MLHRTRTLVLYIVLGLIAACGGGGGDGSSGGGTGPTGPTTIQMGGARQGVPLNLTTAVTTFVGATRGRDGVGATASFQSPGTAVVAGDSVYVADTYNNTIRRIVTATGAVTTLAGTAGTYGSADGLGAAARFYFPLGIASDGTNLYVADTYNHTIRRIVIATGAVTTLAGAPYQPGSADGTGAV